MPSFSSKKSELSNKNCRSSDLKQKLTDGRRRMTDDGAISNTISSAELTSSAELKMSLCISHSESFAASIHWALLYQNFR